MNNIFKVKLYRYIKEESEIYVEAFDSDEAALSATEAISWIEPVWTKEEGSYPKLGTPLVVGPVCNKDIASDKVYKRK